jgi:hypothetical protein
MGERKAPRPPQAPRPGRKQAIVTQQINDDAPAGTPPPGRMEPALQDHIGRQLRAVYEQVLDEPVPERFLKLLSEFQNKQSSTS